MTGELTLSPPWDNAALGGVVFVVAPVKTDDPAFPLPVAGAIPEVTLRGTKDELGIVILRDDCHYRRDTVLIQESLDSLPDRPVHGRAEVVEAKDESRSLPPVPPGRGM